MKRLVTACTLVGVLLGCGDRSDYFIIDDPQPNEAPALIGMLRRLEESRVKSSVSPWYSEKQVRDALVKVGKPAVAPLIQCLAEPDLYEPANIALLGIGDQAEPELVAALKQPNPDVRRGAIGALSEVYCRSARSTHKKEITLALIVFLRDENERVRATAASALPTFAEKIEEVSGLLECLGDPNAQVRSNAADALAEMTWARKEIILALRQRLMATDGRVRASAANSLENIGPPAKGAVRDLTGLLADKEDRVRAAAACAIGRIRLQAPKATPLLLGMLREHNHVLRESALRGLEGTGPHSTEVARIVVSCLWDENSDVRSAALITVRRFGPKVVPALVQALEGEDIGQSRNRECSEAFSVVPHEWWPELAAQVKDENGRIRWLVADLLRAESDRARESQALFQAGKEIQDELDRIRKDYSPFADLSRNMDAPFAFPVLLLKHESSRWEEHDWEYVRNGDPGKVTSLRGSHGENPPRMLSSHVSTVVLYRTFRTKVGEYEEVKPGLPSRSVCDAVQTSLRACAISYKDRRLLSVRTFSASPSEWVYTESLVGHSTEGEAFQAMREWLGNFGIRPLKPR